MTGTTPEGWPGMDEHVVRPYAEAAGRTLAPLFPQPEGDVLLFAFLMAGLIGGWVLGYGYRALFVEGGRRGA